ncbi:MAG: zf-HC2 domain-containing protein [Gemmatimonadota bacterium]
MNCNCTHVVRRFTDYLDGNLGADETAEIDAHLKECGACVRYRNVLVHGAEVLRTLPEPELREDFGPRLRHRLYHVDDERMLHAHAASGAPAMTVLGIALLLTAIAWSPTLVMAWRGDAPASTVATNPRPVQPVATTPPGTFSSKTDGEEGLADLFSETELYPYTKLSQRYDQRGRQLGYSLTDR